MATHLDDRGAPGDPYRQGQQDTPHDPAGDVDMSLVGHVNRLLRYRRLLFGLPLLMLVVTVVLTVLSGSRYKSQSRFMAAASTSAASRLSSIAAQFGFALAGAESGESITFYGQLVKSRELLEAAATSSYRFATSEDGDTLEGTLIELYGIEADTPEEELIIAIDQLAVDASVGLDVVSGLVTVAVVAPWAGLAEQMNRRLLDLVNQFNLERRQSQAKAEREFVESRLDEARAELEAAEGELEIFLVENRSYQESPRLRFEAARLQRRVDLRQQVYTSLAQAYEQARIDQVRNTPVITIVESPEGSARPDRNILKNAILALIIGVVVALVVILLREYLNAQRSQHPAEYAEFEELREATLGKLVPRRIGKLLSRARSPDTA